MIILITGSLGTLGQPLVRELRDRDYEVAGCDIRHTDDELTHRADIANFRQLDRVFCAVCPDVVYHLAAEFGRLNGEEYYEDCWRTAVVGTRNVLELCKQHEARLISASSSEIYGELDEEWLTEDLPDKKPLWQPNEYALSKWANEVQIVNFQRRNGLNAVCLRLFNAYGPGECYTPYRSVVALFCHRLLRGRPIDVFKGYRRTFMYMDDFIPTLANVSERALDGPVNIGGRDYRSVEELAQIVLEHTGANPELINYVPEDRHNVRSKRPDISRAERYLGHDPKVTLDTGIPLTLRWMRNGD